MSFEAIAYAKMIDLHDCEGPAARLLVYVLAENTFNDTFVCRLCQEQLAFEARISDRSVRRHLDALEKAGILIRAKRRDASGNMLPDNIRLVGFKRWYHRDHGSRKRSVRAASPPAKLAGGSEGGSDANHRPNCPPVGGQIVRPRADNRCPATGGQQVSGTEDSLTSTSRTLSTPNPEGGGQEVLPIGFAGEETEQLVENPVGKLGTGSEDPVDDEKPGDVSARQAELIAQLRADGVAMAVVDRLLVPMLTQKRFSAKAAIEELRAARNAARTLTPALLDKALHLILTCGVGTIKPSRLRDAIAAVSKHGLMVPIRKGTGQWAAWVRHFGAKDPKQAKVMNRFDVWQVAAEWPLAAENSILADQPAASTGVSP